jgi:hypothetical protein
VQTLVRTVWVGRVPREKNSRGSCGGRASREGNYEAKQFERRQEQGQNT